MFAVRGFNKLKQAYSLVDPKAWYEPFRSSWHASASVIADTFQKEWKTRLYSMKQPPLSGATRVIKAGPIIPLRNIAYKIKREDKMSSIFVGLPRGKASSIFLIQENGTGPDGMYRIKVTDKMRRWFRHKGIHIKNDTKEIIIPSRPTFAPAFNKVKPLIENSYVNGVVTAVDYVIKESNIK